jgi:hypothetical protein
MHLLALLAMSEIQGMTETPVLKALKVSLESVESAARKVSAVSQVMTVSMA